MRDASRLEVTAVAEEMAVAIYELTRSLPSEERYGLTSQLRRAAVSVGSNIAEGCGRSSDAQLRSFLEVAMGSASEVEFQLRLSIRLGYLTPDAATTAQRSLTRTKRMLAALQLRLRKP
ncbi:MAG: four helix bundle protein [Gemmatimonadaceae bacterium]|nr:four helix bundle protein [Gemmatimonadaceae bacterium]